MTNNNFIIQLIDSGHHGQIIAINMLDAIEENLIDDAIFISFIEQCSRAAASYPTESTIKILEGICKGVLPPASSAFLRIAKTRDTNIKGHVWTTVVPLNTWLEHHVDIPKVTRETGISIPPKPLPSDPSEIEAIVRSILKHPAWWKKAEPSVGGWLGLPADLPSNCWVSTEAIRAKSKMPTYLETDSATAARDGLGLVDKAEGTWLIRYKFSAKSGTTLASGDVARPTHADLGNTRFRVRDLSTDGRSFAKKQWGCTVHLKKLEKSAHRGTSGLPERVTKALPIEHLDGIEIELLGPVSSGHARTEDGEFVKHILAGRSIDEIKNSLIQKLNLP